MQTANPGRGGYPWSSRGARRIAEVRERTARFIGAGGPKEIVFTPGATAGLNAVALSWGLANLADGDEILYSPNDHSSNVYPWWHLRQVLAGLGRTITLVPYAVNPRQPALAGPPRRAVIIACDRLEPYLSYFRKRRPDLFGQARRATPGDVPDDVVAAAPELSVRTLAGMIRDPALLCVDTRGSMAYRIGHLPGSVNIRDDYVEDMLRHGNPFPGGRTIVFICPVGEYSRRLAAFLRQAGHDAASLSGGVVAWRDAGLPLESSLTPAAGLSPGTGGARLRHDNSAPASRLR